MTDVPGLTTHLKSADFFDVERFPEARFLGTTIEHVEGDLYRVTGDLTIRDITETVTFVATITPQYATMTYNLDRTRFGIGPPAEGLKAIDATVPLEARIIFRRDNGGAGV